MNLYRCEITHHHVIRETGKRRWSKVVELHSSDERVRSGAARHRVLYTELVCRFSSFPASRQSGQPPWPRATPCGKGWSARGHRATTDRLRRWEWVGGWPDGIRPRNGVEVIHSLTGCLLKFHGQQLREGHNSPSESRLPLYQVHHVSSALNEIFDVLRKHSRFFQWRWLRYKLGLLGRP